MKHRMSLALSFSIVDAIAAVGADIGHQERLLLRVAAVCPRAIFHDVLRAGGEEIHVQIISGPAPKLTRIAPSEASPYAGALLGIYPVNLPWLAAGDLVLAEAVSNGFVNPRPLPLGKGEPQRLRNLTEVANALDAHFAEAATETDPEELELARELRRYVGIAAAERLPIVAYSTCGLPKVRLFGK